MPVHLYFLEPHVRGSFLCEVAVVLAFNWQILSRPVPLLFDSRPRVQFDVYRRLLLTIMFALPSLPP